MKLPEIKAGMSLSGVEPTQIVSVVATVPQGDGALQLIYRTPDGGMKDKVIARGFDFGVFAEKSDE